VKGLALSGALFITGATGLIGRALLAVLDEERFPRVCCLTRDPARVATPGWTRTPSAVVRGSLLDREAYRTALEAADTVVHLAAATGKTNPDEYFKVNVEGTRVLLEECRRAGVRNLLHVSTIAVKYKDKRRYYYAQSKEQSEQIVHASGLNYVIVRPTIVIDGKAPALIALMRMARASIVPIIGDGLAPIQPIYLDDLVACLSFLLTQGRFANETIELGGPETITMKEFLKEIHFHLYHKQASCIHIPRAPLITALSLVERFSYSLLPVSVGQLAVFGNDSTIAPNDAFAQHAGRMKGIEEMLRLSCEMEAEPQLGDDVGLERECRVLTSYLIGGTPDRYVLGKYLEAHRVSDVWRETRAIGYETFLLRAARTHPIIARAVDAYCRVFLPGSLVRKKCVLLLAILEAAPSAHRSIDAPERSRRSSVLAKLACRGAVFIVLVSLGMAILGPLHLMLGPGGSRFKEQ
jgi:NADH dehydrogenase